MAANVNQARLPRVDAEPEIPFIDKHFTKIAFAVSTLVLMIFSPLFLFLGAASGLALHYSVEPDLTVRDQNEIVTLCNSIFAIVGAMAALIRMLPAGAAGGFTFQSIPLVASFAIGSTIYHAFKSC